MENKNKVGKSEANRTSLKNFKTKQAIQDKLAQGIDVKLHHPDGKITILKGKKKFSETI